MVSSRYQWTQRGIDLPVIVFRLIGLCHMIGMQRQTLLACIYFSGPLLAIVWATRLEGSIWVSQQNCCHNPRGSDALRALPTMMSQCALDHHSVKTSELQGSNALELPMNGNYGKDEVADARY